MEQLESIRKWSPRVIAKLESLIYSDDEFDVFRVNSIRFAKEQKIDQAESIDLFLHTVKIGLFEMQWNMICASCASVFGSFEHMSGLQSHFNCPVCKNQNTSYLDDLIQVTFKVNPQVRDSQYNHPESLSAEDYYYKYYLAEGAIYPPDTSFKDILQQLVRHIEYIEAGEKKTYSLDLEPGAFILRNVNSEASAIIFVKPATALYEKIGDPQAFFVVQQHFAALRGAIVKTIGDAVMATFVHPEDAVKAAQQSLKRIEEFNKTISEEVIIKIGIHCSHCIAVTLNDQQDYFGQTVNIAARVQSLAGPSEVYLSKAVYEAESVQSHLKSNSVEQMSAQVKGIEKALQVYKILA